ncbi:MAG: NAD(P)-binding domain-containing protein, partial [Thermoanaerobaculia bacterium]|nr:NAD(P)-binding domain-containing protein [Thermoanaerobaculia bacterium]
MDLSGSGLLLVGPGRAGSALARSWTAAGGILLAVVGRTRARAEEAGRRLGAKEAVAIEEVSGLRGDVLALAVPDDRIPEVAEALASRVSAPFAYHLSGALAAQELAPLRGACGAIGSLHPLQVFTGAASETWRGVLVAVEGDAAAVARG